MTSRSLIRIALATLVGGLAVAGFAAAAGAFNSRAEAPSPAREGAVAAPPSPAAPAATLAAPSVAALQAAGITRVIRVEREHGGFEVDGLDAQGRPIKARLGSGQDPAGKPVRAGDDDDADERKERRGSSGERDDD